MRAAAVLALVLAAQDKIKFDSDLAGGLKAAKDKGQLVVLYFHQPG